MMPSNIGVKMITLVLIEDDQHTARLVPKCLPSESFTVHHFVKGYAGLEFIRQTRDVNIVLLDMDLPDVDGRNIAAQLKTGTTAPIAPIAVIGFSADCSPRAKRLAIAFGCDDYICKPFDTRALASQVIEIHNRVRGIKPGDS
jgi:DNA-binding response OmpR family regulator